MMPRIAQILTILMAIGCIGGFTAIYGFEIYKAWFKHCLQPSSEPAILRNVEARGASNTPTPNSNGAETRQEPNDIKDPYTYVATALMGLIGGVVAIAFGKPPAVSSGKPNWSSILVAIYVSVYLLVGIAALITWIMPSIYARVCPSILVKSLGLSFFGLVIPTVTNFFKPGSITAILNLSRTVR